MTDLARIEVRLPEGIKDIQLTLIALNRDRIEFLHSVIFMSPSDAKSLVKQLARVIKEASLRH